MFFVFMSLLEFAAVNSYMRQSEKFEKFANSLAKGRKITSSAYDSFSLASNSQPNNRRKTSDHCPVTLVISDENDEEGPPITMAGANGRLAPSAADETRKFLSVESPRMERRPSIARDLDKLRKKMAQENNGDDSDENQEEQLRCLQLSYAYSAKGLMIDKWSRWVFPLSFAGFNTIYWLYYLWYIQRAMYIGSAGVA